MRLQGLFALRARRVVRQERLLMKGDVVLNVILRCTTCGALIDAESYSDYVARVRAVTFPNPVQPYRCEECR